MIGVHNKRFSSRFSPLLSVKLTPFSYGLIADIVECLIQRCFAYSTRDVRVTIDYVKACLADPTITTVILVGHSQGGIVISLVLDYLFADLPASSILKLVSKPSPSITALYKIFICYNQLFSCSAEH